MHFSVTVVNLRYFSTVYDICHRITSCVFCKNYGDCDYRNSIWYGKLKIWTFHVRHFQDKKNFNLDLTGSHNKMSLISCNTIWNTFPVIVVTNVWWWFSLLITMSILIFWKTNQYWNEILEWKSTFDTVFPHLTLAVNDTLTNPNLSANKISRSNVWNKYGIIDVLCHGSLVRVRRGETWHFTLVLMRSNLNQPGSLSIVS